MKQRRCSALHLKQDDQLKEKIIEVYDRDTPHEGVVLPAGDNYNVSVVDQGRTYDSFKIRL